MVAATSNAASGTAPRVARCRQLYIAAAAVIAASPKSGMTYSMASHRIVSTLCSTARLPTRPSAPQFNPGPQTLLDGRLIDVMC